jgi:MraZ protein
MLIGEYIHTIDEKNRLSFPMKFRKEMGKTVVIAPGIEQSLFVFTPDQWKKTVDRLAESSLQEENRSFSRYLIGGASEVEVDANGRILIPESLKEKLGIEDKVAIVGLYTRVELWKETTWKKYKKDVETKADKLANHLGSVGVL